MIMKDSQYNNLEALTNAAGNTVTKQSESMPLIRIFSQNQPVPAMARLATISQM